MRLSPDDARHGRASLPVPGERLGGQLDTAADGAVEDVRRQSRAGQHLHDGVVLGGLQQQTAPVGPEQFCATGGDGSHP